MAMLFGANRVNDKTPPATSLRIQTSLNGQPISIVHGRNRVSGNLIWYGGFAYTGPGKGGGKGGGGGKGAQQTNYSADVIIGVCEGPVAGFGTVWSGQVVATFAAQTQSGYQAASSFNGEQGQAPWGFMASQFPPYALGYTSLAYVGYDPIQLGSSPAMPNLNFEVTGSAANAVTESYTVSGATPTFAPTYWNLSTSVVEQLTIPATSPYQVQAQNPFAATTPIVLQQGANTAGDTIYGPNIPGCSSNGVIDINGRVFTKISGTPTTGQYSVVDNNSIVTYTFAAADAGLQITLIDLALSPGVYYADGTPLAQVIGSPTGAGTFVISMQPGSFGQYQFAAADDGKVLTIVDVPDADPSASLTDFLSNPRYGCGFPTANIGNLTQLQNYAYATGMFISPALVASQAANDYLKDFATGLNGEFVWSSGLLTFVPYGDTTLDGYGKTYAPPSAPIYSLDDDDFLKNEGTAGVGVSAFTSDDPVVCVRTRPSDADNDVKVEYLDRGNSYNPAIAEAQDDAAINLYGLRPADTKQLHFFCFEAAAMMSAQLQLSRQQVRNLYSFTVPWYFILLDPMDIIAIGDPELGLSGQWVRIREITENQQDGTLTITAEEYLQGTGYAVATGSQPRIGYTPNLDAPAPSVN